jgi:hypothetical protein
VAPAPVGLALVPQPGPAGPADVALPVSERVTIMELREFLGPHAPHGDRGGRRRFGLGLQHPAGEPEAMDLAG